MSKRIILLMLSLLFILSNTTFAANWVYLQRQEGTRYGPCTEYFDTDSVIKEKDKVIVWLLWVIDETNNPSHDIKKLLFKQEILFGQPMKQGKIEMYTYDAKDQELHRYQYTNQNSYFSKVSPGSMEDNSIDKVFLYVKEGLASDTVQPEHITAPAPAWYKAADLPEGELYLDLSSLMVWPQNPLNKLEVMAKLVWNEQALEERKTELVELSKKTYPLAYENTSYTLFSYQFLAAENKCRIFEVTDYNADDRRTTLLDGITWHAIEADSRDQAVLQAVLNLSSNNTEKN